MREFRSNAPNVLEYSRVLFAPASELTLELQKHLVDEFNITSIGFIDKFKQGKSIFDSVNGLSFDFVIVASPNYQIEILKNFPFTDLYYVEYRSVSRFYDFKRLSCARHFLIKQNIQFYEWFRGSFLAKLQELKHIKRGFALKQYKNTHLGKRAFILANGPSLNTNDIEKTKNDISFAANKIWLTFEDTDFRPTYYCVTDYLVMTQNYSQIAKLESDGKFFPDYFLPPVLPKLNNVHYFDCLSEITSDIHLEKGIYPGHTVIFTMIMLAIYMGIKEIYLIGLDHRFLIPKNFIGRDTEEPIVSEGEVNHFHPDYRKPGEKWAQPQMEELTQAFINAKEIAKVNDVEILNASRYSELTVFQRVSFDEIDF